MAYRIEAANRPEDYVDFEVVTNDGETHTMSILMNDCLPETVVAELREWSASIEETDPQIDVLRAEMKIISEHKYDTVFDKLVQRQIVNLRDHYVKASEGDLGE